MLVELGLVVWHYAMPSAYRLRASTVATEPTVATRYPARVTNFGLPGEAEGQAGLAATAHSDALAPHAEDATEAEDAAQG